MQLTFANFETLKEEITANGIIARDYQQKAIEKCFELWDKGEPGCLVRQPTGTGKTIVTCLLAPQWLGRSKDHRIIVLTYERQLNHQFAAEIEDVLGEAPGIEMAKEVVAANKMPKIIVASRQTLYERTVETEDGEIEQASRLYKFDNMRYHWLVVLDETHRWLFRLKSCRHILEWFQQNPESRRLGLTATPMRGDKRSLRRVVPAVAADYPLYDINGGPCAVDDGWAVPYDQRFVTVEGVDFTTIKEVAKDFDAHELEAVMKERETLLSMVKPTLDIVEDRRTLIFNPTVNMAKWVAHTINEFKPDQAVSINGTTPEDVRADTYHRHQTGQFQFLSICGLCLGSGTLILTDRGEVPIEHVTTDMNLWDGAEFVPHDGVISKGVKPVIKYAGLTATGGHNVWTDDGWVSLATCKQQRLEIRVGGIKGKTVLESGGYYRGADSSWKIKASGTGSKVRRLRSSQRQGYLRNQKVSGWLQKLLQSFRCPKLAIDALSFCKKTMREFTRRILQGLRREGDQVQLCFTCGDGQVDHGQHWSAQELHHRPYYQQRPLRTGKPSLGQSGAAGEQSPNPKTRIHPEPKGDTKTAQVEVYDILNVGPRHRFTANGLIVSNCREGYNDPAIGAVAIFRPTKSRGLAEQMKGRGCRPLRGLVDGLDTPEERRAAIASSSKPSCVVVDLVGCTGLADCVSTAHILAEGLPDEVIERANKNALKKDGSLDMGEEVRQAKKKIDEEEREKARLEREERERKEKERAARLSRFDGEVRYTQTRVRQGHGSRVYGPGRQAYMPFGKFKGQPVAKLPKWYLESLANKDWCKTKWIKQAARQALNGNGKPVHAGPANDNQKRVLARLGKPVDVSYAEAAAIISKAYPVRNQT